MTSICHGLLPESIGRAAIFDEPPPARLPTVVAVDHRFDDDALAGGLRADVAVDDDVIDCC